MRESFDDYPVYAPPKPVAAPAENWDEFPTVAAAPTEQQNLNTALSKFVASAPIQASTPAATSAPASIEVPLAGAGPNGESVLPSQMNPFANTSIGPASPDAFVPDATRYKVMAANAIGKGLSSIATGIPDIVAAPTQILSNVFGGDKDTPWNYHLFPMTNAAFKTGAAAEKALGVPDVEPKGFKEKLATNALMFGSGALIPDSLAVNAFKTAAPVAEAVGATETAAKLADPLTNYPRLFTDARVQAAANERASLNPSTLGALKDVATPTAAKLASGVGAGAGATAAESIDPDSPLANMLAAYLGGRAGPTSAKIGTDLITAPSATLNKVVQGSKLEPAFASEGPKLALPNTAANVDAAAKIFQDMAVNPKAAAANIEEQMPLFANDAVQQTPANMSKDIGIMRLEKGARIADQKTGNRFIANDQALQEQNIADFKKLAPAETGNKQATVDTIAAQTQAVKDAENARVTNEEANLAKVQTEGTATLSQAEQDRIAAQNQAESAVDQAKLKAEDVANNNTVAAQNISATPRMPREQAGETLVNDVLTPAKQAQLTEYRSMIAPFERDISTPVSTDAAREAVQKVQGDISAGVDLGPDKALIDNATKLLASNERTGVNNQGNILTRQSNPSELLNLEQRLNQASRDARAAGRGASVQALNTVRQGVNDVLDNAGLGDNFRNSRDFYRENIAEPFSHGVSHDVLAAGSHGEQFKNAPAEAVGKYFQSGPKGGQSMDQLLSAAHSRFTEENGKTTAREGGLENITPIIQSHVAENMVDKFYNSTTMKFNTAQMRKYLNDHREAFARVPEIRDDWTRIANQLDAGKNLHDVALKNVVTAKESARQTKLEAAGKFGETQNQVNQNLQLAKQRVNEVQADADAKVLAEQKSAARFYLNDPDPDKAIAKALGTSNNPVKDLTELRVRAAKDKSGKASLGLKEAIYDNLQGKIEKASKTLETGSSPITPADLEMIKKNRDALIKSGIFSEKDGEILSQLQRRIETTQRGVDLKAMAGSATAENQALSETQKAIARSSLRTIFGGFEGGNKYSILKDSISLITGADQKARAINHIIQRSLLDPQLAVLLLKRDLSKYEESLFYTKVNRILTNRSALAYTAGEKKNVN